MLLKKKNGEMRQYSKQLLIKPTDFSNGNYQAEASTSAEIQNIYMIGDT